MKGFVFIIFVAALSGCSSIKKPLVQNSEELFINNMLSKMSIDDKIGQTNLRGTSSRSKELSKELKEAVRQGKVGALLNVMNVDYVDELQKIAVEESPHKIPLIFGRDVIHGFKTIFPIPLGLAASWDASVVQSSSRIAAIEASSVGIRWTFAPMLDIARDSRWGRIAESPGEDPYLASVLAKAYVDGFQTNDLKNPTSMAACAKHFLGYGAAIGGRDYNSADIPESLLRNVYLPPFKAAFDAGVASVMSSFNELNGVPATGNKFILKQILRNEYKFDGFVVSDWNSVSGMIDHGFAQDEKHAGELASNAGLDMEMTSTCYEKYLKDLIKEGKFTEKALDEFVKNILRIKYRMGLFTKPHREKSNTGNFYSKAHLAEATKAAENSIVLLKNENILPLKTNTSVAVIGPLADAPHDQLGTWTFDGEKEHTITPLQSFTDANCNFKYVQGLTYSRDISQNGFSQAIEVAKNSDVILFFGGEESILSGEAHSRASIHLPGIQEQLIKELAKTGKPIVLIIMAGRPITISSILNDIQAVVMAWHPGTMGGEALRNVLYGYKNPQGRLPVSWPKTAGQLPYFYNHTNTGRPADAQTFVSMDAIPINAWQSSLGNTSHYLDSGFTPQFPFGFGLSYTKFNYENIQISKESISFNESVTIKASITNTGTMDGVETIQLYVQDVVGSITRPVKELKKFIQQSIKVGETKEVSFTLDANDLKFTNNELIHAAEAGAFNVYIGPDASSGLKSTFYLKN